MFWCHIDVPDWHERVRRVVVASAPHLKENPAADREFRVADGGFALGAAEVRQLAEAAFISVSLPEDTEDVRAEIRALVQELGGDSEMKFRNHFTNDKSDVFPCHAPSQASAPSTHHQQCIINGNGVASVSFE